MNKYNDKLGQDDWLIMKAAYLVVTEFDLFDLNLVWTVQDNICQFLMMWIFFFEK